MLPEIVKVAKGKCEIYIDGGVRRGSDVFKALALGADIVFMGRPIVWGLSYNGQAGVEKVLKQLNDELRTTMILTNCLSIDKI